MTLGGQIREVIAIGRIAIESDQLGDANAIQAWFGSIEASRGDTGHPPLTGFGRQSQIRYLSVPDSERAPVEEMATQALTFRVRAGNLLRRLTPVDAALVRLLAALHPGGGTQAY